MNLPREAFNVLFTAQGVVHESCRPRFARSIRHSRYQGFIGRGRGERLGDYLALSISCDDQNTTVSFTTTHTHPETFAVFLPGVAASSLQTLLIESSLISPLDRLF
jgi:hypothetical protein